MREGEIDAAVGQADVVEDEIDALDGDEGANLFFDLREVLLGVLDAHAFGRVDVEAHLAGVDVGKEVAADEEDERQGEEHKQSKQAERDRCVCDTPLERALVAVRHSVELALESGVPAPDEVFAFFALTGARVLVEVDLRAEEEVHHGGNQGAGEEVAGHHGEDDGAGQGGEQVFGRTGEEQHGGEDDADGQRGDEGRGGDLLCRVKDGARERLALGHVAVGVFDLDGGVVDEDTDGEGEAAQRHDVDGFAEGAQDDERRCDGERDGGADDQGGAP